MKKFLYILISLLCYMAASSGLYAQGGSKLVLDESSFAPVHVDPLTGVNIDPIAKDRSNRECARVKIHVTRLSSEDIAGISVKTVGGNILVMKKELASGGNGLIVEMTARPGTRFYLHHDILGESNVVTVDLEGNKEYIIKAWCDMFQPITIACDRVGAGVFLDGNFKGQIGTQGVLVIPNVTTGQHLINVADASDEASMTIEVSQSNVYFSIPLKDSSSLQQFVLFKVEPSNATIELDGSVLPVSDGTATKMMRFGTYSYKVYAPKYHPVEGSVTVNSTEKRSEVKVVLVPAFGVLDIVDNPSLNGADVYVDDEYVGKAPFTSLKLSNGSHTVRFVKPMYEPYEQGVTIQEGKTISISPELKADFVKVTLRAVASGKIWVNGVYKGLETWTGDLSKGACRFEVHKEGYRTASISMDLTSDTPSVIDLPVPEPIYGKLVINTTPAMATVHISGHPSQDTPVMISNILIGTHQVRISKEGYQDYVKSVTIKEGETINVEVTLTKGFSSNTSSTTKQLSDYLEAAKNGDAAAQDEVGDCYYYGYGTSINYEEAVKWYRKSAEQGHARAQFNLGVCYESGDGVDKDIAEAVKWYLNAAEQGDARAQCYLGECYEDGYGVNEDIAEAVKWYRMSAEQGHARAQNNLGLCYFDGNGVDKNFAEAVKWFRKSVEQGYVGAQYNLGVCYEEGKGVDKDIAEAVKWYRKSAEQGNATAQCYLGECYEEGNGVKDIAEAVKWYRKSAEQGYARAQNNLGLCYEFGDGVDKDMAEAVKWYRMSAEQGYDDAQYNLGLCYENGDGVPYDETEAHKWFLKAANQGHAYAMNSVGADYFYGTGVREDKKVAFGWFLKSAEAGNKKAVYNVGYCYEYGLGVTRDEAEAKKWYQKAADLGYEDAKRKLRTL